LNKKIKLGGSSWTVLGEYVGNEKVPPGKSGGEGGLNQKQTLRKITKMTKKGSQSHPLEWKGRAPKKGGEKKETGGRPKGANVRKKKTLGERRIEGNPKQEEGNDGEKSRKVCNQGPGPKKANENREKL